MSTLSFLKSLAADLSPEACAESLLRVRLSAEQREGYKRYGWVREYVHGRTYFINGPYVRAFTGAVVTPHPDVHGQCGCCLCSLDAGTTQRSALLTVIPDCSVPNADMTLINLLWLRNDPLKLWTVACLSGVDPTHIALPGARKNIRACIDDMCTNVACRFERQRSEEDVLTHTTYAYGHCRPRGWY